MPSVIVYKMLGTYSYESPSNGPPEKTLQDISPQVPSMLLAKCLGLKYCINNLLDFILAQATTSQLESEVTNLKSRLEFQESELEKANSKFEFSVSV